VALGEVAGVIDRPVGSSVDAEVADELRPAFCIAVAPVAVAIAIVAVVHRDDVGAATWVQLGLVVAWAITGVLVGIRRRSERLGPIALTVAGVGALAMAADSYDRDTLARAAIGLLLAAGFHLLASLPDGRLTSTGALVGVAAAYAIGAVVGALAPHTDAGPAAWPFVVLGVAFVAAGLHRSHRRYVAAGSVDRRRMQWVGWALAVDAEIVLAVIALRLMADWPPHPEVVMLAATVLVPASLVAGTHVRMIARVDRLLTHTVTMAGLTALVVLAYLAVVLALGRTLHDGERALLLLSMAAATIAALAFQPMNVRLTKTANQLVYGERVAPDESLRTWGSRLTRAIPLDELLLQLVESLRKSMSFASAEIFTGNDGHYELAAGVPHRDATTLSIGAKERNVVARAGVSGGTWLEVWIPDLAGANSQLTRVAPIAHAGQLLGLIVLTRRSDGESFNDDSDRVVTELARQVALALHNVQLDSALQASLAELQQTNVDLVESRRRIVSAGDKERRKLERNLHDGAQQHLVAMAVKLRMIEELVEDDPAEAVNVIAELRDNLKDAIAELRALAHGIFPPLLSSGGLPEALPAAASRSALITTVATTDVGRYTPEVESTVYFCCLEAMQNAAKHAGVDAEIAITVAEVTAADGARRLEFAVADDGGGFDLRSQEGGHGFVNMRDRLGTVGGSLVVTSVPGDGTTVRGVIPL
jgi:signal transduction histidine kinase